MSHYCYPPTVYNNETALVKVTNDIWIAMDQYKVLLLLLLLLLNMKSAFDKIDHITLIKGLTGWIDERNGAEVVPVRSTCHL